MQHLPYYLIDEDGETINDVRFATEDEAYDWVEANLGCDAWNDTAILASDQEGQTE